MNTAFINALDAFKRCNSLDNAMTLARAFGFNPDAMQELNEPDAGLVRGACKLFDREQQRRNAEMTRRFNKLTGF